MINKEDFLRYAQALPEGRSQRVGHHCGPGECMTVTHKADGYSAWCFRCNESGWVPKVLSLTERIERLREKERADEEAEDIAPPWPEVRNVQDWPLEARVWLYKAGFTNADIAGLGIYFHKRTSRVVLPVYSSDGKVCYWQARGFDPDRPKYLNQPGADRSKLVASYGPSACRTIVLTEDILSAAKVAKFGDVQAWSLLGVQLSDYILLRLLREADEVIVWLDPDWGYPGCPGQTAARKILKILRAAGVKCRNILSRADPKLLSRQEVISALSNQAENR